MFFTLTHTFTIIQGSVKSVNMEQSIVCIDWVSLPPRIARAENIRFHQVMKVHQNQGKLYLFSSTIPTAPFRKYDQGFLTYRLDSGADYNAQPDGFQWKNNLRCNTNTCDHQISHIISTVSFVQYHQSSNIYRLASDADKNALPYNIVAEKQPSPVVQRKYVWSYFSTVIILVSFEHYIQSFTIDRLVFGADKNV